MRYCVYERANVKCFKYERQSNRVELRQSERTSQKGAIRGELVLVVKLRRYKIFKPNDDIWSAGCFFIVAAVTNAIVADGAAVTVLSVHIV